MSMIKIPLQIIHAKQKPHIHEVSKMALFCPDCGEPLYEFAIENRWICEHCKFALSETAKYCHICGTEFTSMGAAKYWCLGSELDKEAFINLTEVLNLSKEDVK